MTSTRQFRAPNFQRDGESDTKGLLEAIATYRKESKDSRNKGGSTFSNIFQKSLEQISESNQEGTNEVQEVKESSTANKRSTSNNISATSILALEPHIAAFRKLKETQGNDDQEASLIPPQLLRVVRFFPSKWTPLKQALLRSPSRNEVGLTSRFMLAQELHKCQFLSTAELEMLENSIHEYKITKIGKQDESTSISSRKRSRYQLGIGYELKMTFSRLPLDKGSKCSLEHYRSTLNSYYEHLVEKKENNDDVVPPELAAQWAIQSFFGIVVSNGIDEPSSRDCASYRMENQIVHLLSNENPKFEGSKLFIQAVKKKFLQLTSPPCIDELSNLNIVCIARFLSYLDSQIAILIFAKSIIECYHVGRGIVGLANLPKLLVTFSSILSNRESGIFSYPNFENELKLCISKETKCKEQIDSEGCTKFVDIIFQSTQMILCNRDGKSSS